MLRLARKDSEGVSMAVSTLRLFLLGRFRLRRFCLVALGFFSWAALGVQTAYLSFKEPSSWSCELAQGVWICQSSKEVDRKESVILSIAAQATQWDTLTNYEKYLNRPKKIQNQDGTFLSSKVVYTRRRNINGTWWVDSLQQNSELPGFWARYLATIHDSKKFKLAILVTYIVSEERYSKLAPEFEQMVGSLQPVAEVNLGTKQGGEFDLTGQKLGNLSKVIKNVLNKDPKPPTVPEPPPPQGFGPLTYGLMVLIVLIGFFVLRSRRKKPTAPPPSQNLPSDPNTRPPPNRKSGT